MVKQDQERTQQFDVETVKELLDQIPDPEIPVLTINDLGIIRNVIVKDDHVTIEITPTYSGCPAMDMISSQIRMALLSNGIRNFTIKTILSPAWTTEWMSESGKKKLEEYGIAAPNPSGDSPRECPHCHSTNTKLLSQFGSTACKALYQCNDCKEPFDYFKCH